MNATKVLLTVLTVLVVWVPLVDSATKVQAYQLYQDLFVTSGYNKYVRPTSDTNNPTEIFMTFSLVSLIDIDEKNQMLKTSAKIELIWEDSLLSWDPALYGGLEQVFTSQEKLWLPDIAVDNSVVDQKQIGFDDLMVKILNDGLVLWTPTVLVTTSCDIEVTYYPFDTQMCYIDYVSLVSTWQEVDINIDKTSPIDTNDFSKDGTWDLIDYHARNMGNEDSKTKIRFLLLLKRRTTFYIINLIMPVLFLSLTASLVFALPADSGEKMGTSITVLLAYAVYLTIVSAYLPNTSVQTSILALYLTILLGYTACGVVVTVFILRIYHKPDSHKVGKHVANTTLFLQTIMCMRKKSENSYHKQPKNSVAPEGKGMPEAKGNEREYSPVSEPPHYEEPMSWRTVAETVDWLCFILFSFLTLATTVTCIVILSAGGSNNAPTIDKS